MQLEDDWLSSPFQKKQRRYEKSSDYVTSGISTYSHDFLDKSCVREHHVQRNYDLLGHKSPMCQVILRSPESQGLAPAPAFFTSVLTSYGFMRS